MSVRRRFSCRGRGVFQSLRCATLVDLLAEADDVLDFFREVVQVTPYRFQFRPDRAELLMDDCAHVVLGGHRGFDVGDVAGYCGEAALDG